MISSEDVRRVTFDRTMRGYRCEDVDDYLHQVAASLDELTAANEDMQKKLVVLAQRIAQYRAEEDTLSTTMINAQRLGENIIREAKQKAAEIIRSANIKAEDREQRARDEVELAKQEVTTLKSEADSFKRSLLDLYRKHISVISKIPEYKKPEETAEEPQVKQELQPAAPEMTYETAPEPAPLPVTEEPAKQEVPVQETVYAPETPQEAEAVPAEETYYAQPEETPVQPAETMQAPDIDTVEFAIAPHPQEPEEIMMPEPVADPPEERFEPGAGLYDDESAAPARKPRRSAGAKRSSRGSRGKAAAPAREEEIPSIAFDNFEGVDFDS